MQGCGNIIGVSSSPLERTPMQVSFVLLFAAVLIVAWIIAAWHDRKKVKLMEVRRAARESRVNRGDDGTLR